MSFVDPMAIPRVKEICEELLTMQSKFLGLSKHMDFIDWPEPIFSGGLWSVSSLKYWHHVYDGEFGPAGAEASDEISLVHAPEIQTLGFSMLGAGAEIQWHAGYAGDIYRMHLGLDCPEGDLALEVGNEKRTWKNGEFLMFNDQDFHRAWNHTDKDRLVLLVDIDKSKLVA